MDHKYQFFILQARLLKVEQPEQGSANLENMDIPNEILLHAGERASSGCGGGRVFKVDNEQQLQISLQARYW